MFPPSSPPESTLIVNNASTATSTLVLILILILTPILCPIPLIVSHVGHLIRLPTILHHACDICTSRERVLDDVICG